jgi:hypothetical protein
MGMERFVEFAGDLPPWEAIQRQLTANGLTVIMRMIDGLPAFPDESPPDGWREIRISTAGGMLTLRQGSGRIAIVAWGNADEILRRDWERVAEALAEATTGTVVEQRDDSRPS